MVIKLTPDIIIAMSLRRRLVLLPLLLLLLPSSLLGFLAPRSPAAVVGGAGRPLARLQLAGRPRGNHLLLESYSGGEDGTGSGPEAEEELNFETTIDWDAELKKLNSGEVKSSSSSRQGGRKAPDDVSDAELATLRLKKVVMDSTPQIRVPSWKRLSKDWRFWTALLLTIGSLSALIGALQREELMVFSGHVPSEYVAMVLLVAGSHTATLA